MSRFDYPKDLVAHLRKAWGITWRGVEPDPLPDDALLVPLIETCFFASLTAEEQRPTKFQAVVGDATAYPDALILQRPLPVTPNEIRRLAPAATGYLGISVGRTVEGSAIWGFVPTAASGALTIHVSGPGRLSAGSKVMMGSAVLESGRVNGSAGERLGEVVFEVFENAFSAFLKLVPDPEQQALYRTPFDSWIHRLMGGVAGHGHGGAIFVIPHDAADGAWRSFVRIKHPCDHDAVWRAVAAFAKPSDALDAFGRVDDGLLVAAALTQVDGALVITDRFRILGFGAEVTAPPDVDQIEDAGQTCPVEDYGTRHRSAFRLVKACPEVVAFVCSQDGGLKCARNERGTVVLIK